MNYQWLLVAARRLTLIVARQLVIVELAANGPFRPSTGTGVATAKATTLTVGSKEEIDSKFIHDFVRFLVNNI